MSEQEVVREKEEYQTSHQEHFFETLAQTKKMNQLSKSGEGHIASMEVIKKL